MPDGSPVANYAFDVTPARLVTGLITERGVIAPNRAALAGRFPERGGGEQADLQAAPECEIMSLLAFGAVTVPVDGRQSPPRSRLRAARRGLLHPSDLPA